MLNLMVKVKRTFLILCSMVLAYLDLCLALWVSSELHFISILSDGDIHCIYNRHTSASTHTGLFIHLWFHA